MNMWEHGVRLDPKSYGSLGSGTDLPPSAAPAPSGPLVISAVLAVAILTLAFVGSTGVRAAWSDVFHFLASSARADRESAGAAANDIVRNLPVILPQQRAELALQQVIDHKPGAASEMREQLEAWRGHLQLTPAANSLITIALNSPDLEIRSAGIDFDLAAVDVAKTPASVESLSDEAKSGDQAQRVWALWTLGLLGNRGVEPGRVTEILASQLKDPNVEIRRWAVEGLAYLGTDASINPLIETLRKDASPVVRERAACSLAQSGMLSQEQRQRVIPKLLGYADDSTLDPQTRNWVYQALRDITAQNLPNDPAPWKNWYHSRG